MANIFGGPTLQDLAELWRSQDTSWRIPFVTPQPERSRTIYVVVEGEQIHGGYIPHLVSSDEWSAVTYARDLRAALDGKRWPNVFLYKGELDVVGLTPVEYEESGENGLLEV